MSRKLPVSLTLMALLVVLTPGLFAANATVGTCAGPGIHYTTIQAAVTATAAPATISVCPGTYPEQIEIAKNLTLKGIVGGTGDAAVIIPPAAGLGPNGTDVYGNPISPQIWVHDATAVTLSNLVVDGTGNNWPSCAYGLEGIAFENSSGKIVNNVVRNQYSTDFTDLGGCQNGLAINVESLTTNTVAISNNTVRFYQKNGITASGAFTGPGNSGPSVKIAGNFITGIGATYLNWPGGAGQNGIQVGGGATGSVSGNVVNDNLWFGEYAEYNYDYGYYTGPSTGNGAAGILVYASPGIQITNNTVGSAQYGIAVDSDSTLGSADNTYMESNRVSGTQVFDALDLCSNSNTVQSNIVYGSAESGLHVDDSCAGSGNFTTSGNNNTIKNLVINEGCAGVLEGVGGGNTYTNVTFYGVSNTYLAGDTCTPPALGPTRGDAAPAATKKPGLHASPYIPVRK